MSKQSKLARRATTAAMLATFVAPVLFAATASAQSPTGTLGGSVWFDRDSDGTRQDGEPARAGAIVKAKGSGGEFTALTDPNGGFTFPGLPLGAYAISHEDNAFAATTATSVKAVLSSGTTAAPVHFGLRGATVCGTVWRDTNEDGARQPGEPRIADSALGVAGTGNYTSSDAEGNYCLTDVAANGPVLGAIDRSMHSPKEGWTQEGDSKFGFATGETQPLEFAPGATVTGIDAGYRLAQMDMRASQLILEYRGQTYAADQAWLDAPVAVGEEFTIYGSAVPYGNVAEQLRANLTVPAGLTIIGQAGGMRSHIQGQTAFGYFEGRRHPGAVEFVGVRVRVDAAFDPSEIRVEAVPGVYGDSDTGNNVLTAPISAQG